MDQQMKEAVARGLQRSLDGESIKTAQFKALSELGGIFKRFFDSGGSSAGRSVGDSVSGNMRQNIPESGQVDYQDVMKQTLEDQGENPNYVDQLFE